MYKEVVLLFETLLQAVVNSVTFCIERMGYTGIAVAMALESACIPIPSEVILPFGGFLVARNVLSFWGVVMAGTIGGTVGSIGAYLVGYYGGRPVLLRYGRYVFLSPKHLEQAEFWFERYGQATAFFTRLLPIVRTFISLPAGMAKMPFKHFVAYTFLGSFPWCWLMTYLGVQLGERWEFLGAVFHRVDIIVLAAIAVLACFLLLRRKHRN